MNIWNSQKWRSKYNNNNGQQRTGLHIKCQKGVCEIVAVESKQFCAWLRKNYNFPIRIPIYLKKSEYIRAKDGDLVSAVFFEPFDKYSEPYISIATGTFLAMEKAMGTVNAIGSILCSIAHELTHYYQWINDIQLTEAGYERQAVLLAKKIVGEYFDSRGLTIMRTDGFPLRPL